MFRRLTATIIAFFFVFLFIFVNQSLAIELPGELNNILDESTYETSLKSYCTKRTGNQMNLETWYSGKCKTGEEMQGEAVGFSDIVLLDLAERISGERDPDKNFIETVNEAIKALEGVFTSSTLNPTEKQQAAVKIRTDFFNSQSGGILGQVTQATASLVNTRPATTQAYLSYVKDNLQKHHVIPQTMAAGNIDTGVTGAGFATISAFMPLWKMTRNLAYLAMVLVFIAYGFMMMFRVNLGQKTAITIQLAIPKLITTFLIITFSYAIVGLVLDFMWVFFWLIYYYLDSQNIIKAENMFIWGASGRGGMILSWLFNSIAATIASPMIVVNIILGGPNMIGALIGLGGFSFFGWLFSLIIILAVLISFIKLFFKLVTSFLSIIISLITGPVVLLSNALPGSKTVGEWFRGLIANAAVFPFTMILLLFSFVLLVQPLLEILEQFGLGSVGEALLGVEKLTSNTFATNYINNIPLINPPLGFNASSLLALLGFALLLMSSKYIDMVKDALKIPPFKYGTAIGEALKSGVSYAASVPGVENRFAYKVVSKVSGAAPKNIFNGLPATPTTSGGGGNTTEMPADVD